MAGADDEKKNANVIDESDYGYDAVQETWDGAFVVAVVGCAADFWHLHSSA